MANPDTHVMSSMSDLLSYAPMRLHVTTCSNSHAILPWVTWKSSTVVYAQRFLGYVLVSCVLPRPVGAESAHTHTLCPS